MQSRACLTKAYGMTDPGAAMVPAVDNWTQRQLAELILLTATCAPRVIPRLPDWSDRIQQVCYRHLRSLFDHWLVLLPTDEVVPLAATTPRRRIALADFVSIVEQSVLCDALVRTWLTVLVSGDVYTGQTQARPVAEHLYLRALQVRQRWLQVLQEHPHNEKPALQELNSQRGRIERWLDMLIGPLVRQFGVMDFCYDLDRALEFGETQLRDGRTGAASAAQLLSVAGFRLSFLDRVSTAPLTARPLGELAVVLDRSLREMAEPQPLPEGTQSALNPLPAGSLRAESSGIGLGSGFFGPDSEHPGRTGRPSFPMPGDMVSGEADGHHGLRPRGIPWHSLRDKLTEPDNLAGE